MRVNVDGVWTEWPDDTPLTVPFDPSRPWTERLGDNRGCPPGYFAEYVPGWFGSTTVVCRLMDEQVATNPRIIREETGPGLWDQTTITMADAARTTVEQVSSAAERVGGALLPWGTLLVALGLGLWWFSRRR